ncbi:MAG: hypothetical protein QOJ03_588, partial [Frankiaceae bacterium]|nr:hypothetical protein [Frankiaceae bacterium]
MSPIDDELRTTLRTRALDIVDGTDPLTGVERRARVIQRRRIAVGTTGGLTFVAVAVVGGLALTGASTDRLQAPPLAQHTADPSSSPSPSTSTSPVPSPTPTLLPASAGALGWRSAGSGTDDWVRWSAVRASVAEQVPADFLPIGTPHVVGTGDTDGGAVVVFVVPAGAHLVAGAVRKDAAGEATAVHDIADDGDVPYVGVVVRVQSSSGPVDDGLVVGAPTTGQILFKLPGQPDFVPAEGADARWATVTLGLVQPGQPAAQVQVLDGDGNTD